VLALAAAAVVLIAYRQGSRSSADKGPEDRGELK
jgi:hypothetical protein